MKRARDSEQQIIGIPAEHEAGPICTPWRCLEVSMATSKVDAAGRVAVIAGLRNRGLWKTTVAT